MEHLPRASEPQPPDSEAVAALAAELGSVLRESRRVDCAWLFGSVARGDAGPLSDVDVAVLLSTDVPPQDRLIVAANLVEDLERRCGRIDLALLDEASPLLRHRVLRDGILLLERDPRRRIAFEARAILEYLDFKPIAEIYDRALLARAREGRFGH